MPLTECTAGIAEVAEALGVSEAWLRRHHRTLSDERGFPRRLPTGWRWPRRLVELWLTTGGIGRSPLRPANDDAPADDAEGLAALVDAQRASLTERYGGRG